MNCRLLILPVSLFSGCFFSAEAQFHLPKPPDRHIVKRKPFVPTTQTLVGQIGLGGVGGYAATMSGLEYERFVTKPQWISVTCKLGGYLGGTLNLLGGRLKNGEVWSQNRGYFVAPGMRFHPLRNLRYTDVGIGVFFPLGQDIRRDNAPGSVSGGRTTAHFLGAGVAELSVNLRPRSQYRAIVGFFANWGYCYANDPAVYYTYPDSRYINHSEADPLIVQVGLRFGTGW
jgi:hypothetical protein